MSDHESADQGPVDLLRLQLVGDEWHYTIAAEAFREPAEWGTILADIAREIAEALNEAEGRDPAVTLKSIGDEFVTALANGPSGAEE